MTDTAPLALIIEDDEKLSIIFTQALKMAGFEAQAIHDGQQAMERLSQVTPALVLLDMHLPGVSGDKILNFIRQADRLAHTRVIMATADAEMANALQDQSDLALVKPISFTQLRDLATRLKSTLA
jgi:DNA-binding response OmpR family regulator